MAKAIIFDCFGVLTTDKWKEFVAALPPAQRTPASELNRAYGGAHITKEEFLQAIRDLTGKSPTDIDKTLDSDTVKNTELLDYIVTLKPAFKICLLSNVASNWIRERFLTPAEQSLFDCFIFSYEVRLTKPDPQIFILAAERMEVEPKDCILVDDIERYCTVAEELGMKTVVYRDLAQTKADINRLIG